MVSRAHDWWTTLRAANLPTVWSNALLGAALSVPAGEAVFAGGLIAALAGLSLLYLGGMAMNDAVDASFDAATGSRRAVACGSISVTAAASVSGLLLAAGCCLLWVAAIASPIAGAGQVRLIATGVLLASIVAYNLVHRRHALAAAALMAVCRGCVPVVAALVLVGSVQQTIWLAAAAVAVWTTGVTIIGRGERGGESRVGGGVWWLVAAAAAAIPMIWLSDQGRVDAAAGGLLITMAAWIPAVARFRRAGEPVRAVCWAIAGFGVLDGSLLLAAGHEGWAAISVLLAAFTLGAQRLGRGS